MSNSKTVRSDEDHFDQFIRDRVVKDQSSEIQASDLYASYVGWCEQKNVRKWSPKALGLALVERGFERRKSSIIFWLGVSLRVP